MKSFSHLYFFLGAVILPIFSFTALLVTSSQLSTSQTGKSSNKLSNANLGTIGIHPDKSASQGARRMFFYYLPRQPSNLELCRVFLSKLLIPSLRKRPKVRFCGKPTGKSRSLGSEGQISISSLTAVNKLTTC